MLSQAEFETLLLDGVHESWRDILGRGLRAMNSSYVESLRGDPGGWLPGPAKCLRAFCVPIDQVKVVWMGESPYPRRESSTGFAFEDGRAKEMFGADEYFGTGIDASLRTILKAWFVAIGLLDENTVRKKHVQRMPKDGLVQRPADIFSRGAQRGWVWLNAAPGFFLTGDNADKASQVSFWSPLVKEVLTALQPFTCVQSVLIGRLAREEYRAFAPNCIEAVHPADRAGGKKFIKNPKVRDLLLKWRCLIET